MKNEILDEIITDDLYRHLKSGEKVIWEGKPNYKFSFWRIFGVGDPRSILTSLFGILLSLLGVILVLLLSMLLIFAIYGSGFSTKTFFFILIFAILSGRLSSFYKRRKTKYLITNQRILFQLWDLEADSGSLFKTFWLYSATEIHSIPFVKIKDTVIQEDAKNYGTIFLAVKNPQQINFDTHDLKSGERRHQPTLEMIQNINEVNHYIKLGIQGKL